MRHALHAAAMICFHRNHKTIVANRHELVLNCFRRTAHQALKRARDARAQRRDVVTNLREFRTRAIVEFSGRQNLVADSRHETVQIAWQALDQLPQHRCVLTLRQNRGASGQRLLTQSSCLQNRERIERRAFNV